MTPVSTILLVEGRKPAVEYLSPVLNDQGYNVVTAHTRRDALAKAQEVSPAVIVVDTPSLRFGGRRFCNAVQDAGLGASVLVLLSEGEKVDRGDGARAHLRYPLSAKKLANQIARLLPMPDDEVLRVGNVTLNLKQRWVICGKRESNLTPKQARLLEVFMRHPDEILTRAFLMRQVWDTDFLGDTRTLEVHIHWLRKAVEGDPESSVCLHTIRRVGYRFELLEEK